MSGAKHGGIMGPQRDATNIIYTAGALLILNAFVQWEIDNAAIGLVCAVIGATLIVQRIFLNRKRKRANAEKIPRIAKEP